MKEEKESREETSLNKLVRKVFSVTNKNYLSYSRGNSSTDWSCPRPPPD